VQRYDHLAQLRSDGDRMADLAGGDLQAPVPTCPDWTLADLVEHTGFVHRWQTAVVRDDTDGFPPKETWRHGPADGQPLDEWFRQGVDDAIAVMSGVDPAVERWTWAGPGGDVAWYLRRISQETLVHRIDAELTAGSPIDPVDPVVAVDGVDEMCDVFIPLAAGHPIGGSGETLHLHATDAEGEWLLTLHDERVDVARGHAKGDAAVRGAALDLLLLVWGRDPVGEIEQFGDPSVVDRFRASAKI
jgi:uncharacterized protein (TIGR03083 family)